MENIKPIVPMQTMEQELLNGTVQQIPQVNQPIQIPQPQPLVNQAVVQPPQATTKTNKVTINNITGYKIPVLSNPSDYFISDTKINREDTPRNNLKKVHVSDMISAEIFKKHGLLITEKLYNNAIAQAFGIVDSLNAKYGENWLSSYNKSVVADTTQIQSPQAQSNVITDHKPLVDYFLSKYGNKTLEEQLDLLSQAKTIKYNNVSIDLTTEIMNSLVNGVKIADKKRQPQATEL